MSNLSNKTTMSMTIPSAQSGFTLIELMITLILGLLISAAALQIYVTNIKTSNIQRSSSELQEASVFGVQQLEGNLRLANLGNKNSIITDRALSGGVVLTGFNIGATEKDQNTGLPTRDNYRNPELLTRRSSGLSNMRLGSDQLTIQYRNVTGNPLVDCEGQNIDVNQTVIERYFVRAADPTKTPNPAKVNQLVLACDAGRVNTDSDGNPTGTITNFGQNGYDLISGVDQFKVLLGVQNVGNHAGATGDLSYIPSDVYQSLPNKPAIVAVKIGLVVSGSTSAGEEGATEYAVLGEINRLKADSTRKKVIRTTYETTTLLRNARVISLSGVGSLGSVTN